MKKILFSAIAICGLVGANAQSAVSTATNTLAAGVSANVNLKLEIRNIIRINSATPANLTAVFDQASELDGGLDLSGAGGADGATFDIASNRPFHVDLDATEIVKTDDYAPGWPIPVNPMTLSDDVIKFKVTSADPSVHSYAAGWSDLALSNNNILQAYYGASRVFKLKFKAEPGWNYEGGFYKTTVTVTATQQ